MPKILNFVKIIHYYSKLFTGVLRRNHETATAGCEELATASGRRIPSTCCQVADVPVARDSKPIRRSLKCTPLQVTVGSSRGTPWPASPLVKFPGPKGVAPSFWEQIHRRRQSVGVTFRAQNKRAKQVAR